MSFVTKGMVLMRERWDEDPHMEPCRYPWKRWGEDLHMELYTRGRWDEDQHMELCKYTRERWEGDYVERAYLSTVVLEQMDTRKRWGKETGHKSYTWAKIITVD